MSTSLIEHCLSQATAEPTVDNFFEPLSWLEPAFKAFVGPGYTADDNWARPGRVRIMCWPDQAQPARILLVSLRKAAAGQPSRALFERGQLDRTQSLFAPDERLTLHFESPWTLPEKEVLLEVFRVY
jgi:hypothetical protein